MSVNFEFNAPQYFNTSDDPEADKFFDVTAEMNTVKETIFSPNMKTKDDEEIENQNPHPGLQVTESSEAENCPVSRKVLNELVIQSNQNSDEKNVMQNEAGGDDKQLIEGLDNLTLSKPGSCRKTRIPLRTPEIFEGIKIERALPKEHSMVTRLDTLVKTPVLKLRNRQIPLINNSLESESQISSELPDKRNRTGLWKSTGMKRRASPLSGQKKFVSLAERIQHFYYDTPDRFRTIPRQQMVPQNSRPRQTIPKTPVLSARYRHRPINFPDEKEREEMELKEMKKHQVKAYPLNEKILKGPILNLKVPIEKKPATVPEPFKLSEPKKKEQHQSPVFVFKAHPLPSTILNGPVGIPSKKTIKTTVAVTPKIKVPLRFTNMHDTPVKVTGSYQSLNCRTTKIQPFSFDQRIKECLQKKEETIKKVIEEEKKAANSFKAQPLPNYLGRCVTTHNNSLYKPETHKMNVSLLGGKKEDTPFKARPATVVHQKPFVPVLKRQETVLPQNFNLNTEKRAAERQKFDEKMKKKEEIQAQILKERKEEEERLELQNKLKERKLTEFKAKPVPKYKPFEIVPSDPSCLTLPKTPKCLSTK